jgi:hypothetical protein
MSVVAMVFTVRGVTGVCAGGRSLLDGQSVQVTVKRMFRILRDFVECFMLVRNWNLPELN